MILGKGGISATIIADSINIYGDRLTTLKLHYHRFIHAEFLRHRMFSHSVSSSRAIPVEDMIKQIKDMPATPIYWGENKSGMSANKELDNIELAKYIWETATKSACGKANLLRLTKCHKQVTNRLLEPFQFINQVISSTDWDNFFYLRIHPDAQPEIQELAECIYKAMNLSTPVLRRDSYHLPFIDDEMLHKNGIDDSIKISASVCAQASYRKEDYSIEKAKMIYDKLISSRPLHCYDENTEVLTDNGFVKFSDINTKSVIANIDRNTGEFVSWENPLRIISNLYTGKVYNYENKKLSLRVTEDHTLIGHIVKKAKDRQGELLLSSYKANDIAYSSRSNNKTLGERECRMLPFINNVDQNKMNNIGKLIGFFIGDGSQINSNSIGFHLKKKRKIDYLLNILGKEEIEYSMFNNSDNTVSINLYESFLTKHILNNHGRKTSEKRIGKVNEYDIETMMSIFDGLKNSDGSLKRKTWTYSTTTKRLRDDILNIAPFLGMWAIENKLGKTPNGKTCYGISFQTRQYIRLNDPRKNSKGIKETYVKIEQVENERFYCVSVPNGALVVRKNGFTVISGNCSPFEHIAIPFTEEEHMIRRKAFDILNNNGINGNQVMYNGNFIGWNQERKNITEETCYKFKS